MHAFHPSSFVIISLSLSSSFPSRSRSSTRWFTSTPQQAWPLLGTVFLVVIRLTPTPLLLCAIIVSLTRSSIFLCLSSILFYSLSLSCLTLHLSLLCLFCVVQCFSVSWQYAWIGGFVTWMLQEWIGTTRSWLCWCFLNFIYVSRVICTKNQLRALW